LEKVGEKTTEGKKVKDIKKGGTNKEKRINREEVRGGKKKHKAQRERLGERMRGQGKKTGKNSEPISETQKEKE